MVRVGGVYGLVYRAVIDSGVQFGLLTRHIQVCKHTQDCPLRNRSHSLWILSGLGMRMGSAQLLGIVGSLNFLPYNMLQQ